MASSPKDKFDAAVKVIRGLPKNGSFQPSHELMLKFYSYYKQATEGPCNSPKPGFWDLVNRKKWEAWSNLGEMEREQAMLLYVDELKKVSKHVREMYYPPQIVETMPQTESVTEFLQKLDNFYEMVEDSENQNTMKILEKPKMNGSVSGNGIMEDDERDEEFNHSYNVTQLLKQDIKRWHDRPAVISGQNENSSVTNGNSHAFKQPQNGSLNGNLESDDDEKSGHDEEVDDEFEENEVSSKDWEEAEIVVDWKRSDIQSPEANDSETENEEFCDTSDEPVEHSTTGFSQSFTSYQPLLAASTTTSTPVSAGKSVHFYPKSSSSGSELSDSLFVNASVDERNVSELASFVHHGDRSVLDSYSNTFDVSMCRGGEGKEQERKRQGASQRSREWSSSDSRGAQGGSGGDGGSGAGAGGGGRGLFPVGSGGGDGGHRGVRAGQDLSVPDLSEQIVVTLLRLQHDMSGVLNRLNSLEALVKEGRIAKERKAKEKSWWPFPDLSMKSAVIILIWPLVVHCLIMFITRRQKKLKR